MFNANVEHSVPLPNIHVAIEDFILRRRQEGGATGNLTSCWVAAAAVAMWHKVIVTGKDGRQFTQIANDQTDAIRWQQPSHAKTLMTDARLKSYGLWEVGSTHMRDAWRHFGLRVDGLII